MTDNEINIAIAEACGWKQCPCGIGGCLNPPGTLEYGIEKTGSVIPDYVRDLNAMHEAEKHIVGLADQLQYLNMLSPVHSEWTLATATAKERAEAFLRTKGLWREARVEGKK